MVKTGTAPHHLQIISLHHAKPLNCYFLFKVSFSTLPSWKLQSRSWKPSLDLNGVHWIATDAEGKSWLSIHHFYIFFENSTYVFLSIFGQRLFLKIVHVSFSQYLHKRYPYKRNGAPWIATDSQIVTILPFLQKCSRRGYSRGYVFNMWGKLKCLM